MRDLEAVVEQAEFRGSFGWRLEHDPAIRPLMLTGCRKSGFLKLRWKDTDLAAIESVLADGNTKTRVMALSRGAAGVLAELPRVIGNPRVIAGHKPGARPAGAESGSVAGGARARRTGPQRCR